MADALAVFSIYRQLEGLEQALIRAGDSRTCFEMAFTSQAAFNAMRSRLIEECQELPAFLKSFEHIKPAEIQPGGQHSAYPQFLAQVSMLKQAIRAFMEFQLTREQKEKIGFV